MELKQMMKKSAEVIGETARLVTDRVMDKDFREKAVGTVAEVSLNLADTTAKTLKKTKNFIQGKHLTPGSRENYVEQLEAELETKNREIRALKKKLQRKNWSRK